MAKTQDLSVVTIKIKNGSLTAFYAPYSGALGTNRYIDVTFDAYSTPVQIWVVSTSGSTKLTYAYNTANEDIIYEVGGNQCVAIGDLQSAGAATYSLTGSGSAQITGAIMRFR